MDIQTAIRTSAIIYADEADYVSTNTIQKKFIEAVFIENRNMPLELELLLESVEKKFFLTFSQDETIMIINKAKENIFIIKHIDHNPEKFIVSLTESRYRYLINKEGQNNFEEFTHEFSRVYANEKISAEKITTTIYKYLYELLNSNILLYSNILKPKESKGSLVIDPNKFSSQEIDIINDFLFWDNLGKNKAIFKIVSLCIEYSLVSNHSNGDKTYLPSLRNKNFYLDVNLIYRALGINGDLRKRRTEVFLKKCQDSGQSFYLSKFSRNEFLESIEYNINQLKKIPFGRINPQLFKTYCSNPSFYEFYHSWRNGRLTYSFDTFQAHIIGLFDNLLKKYKISIDFKIPFDEKEKENIDKIQNYKEQLDQVKPGVDRSNLFDAQNIYLIEKKRGDNNNNIQDTKFYLITTDQKLKSWDDENSSNQSVTMLPSHWMGLLLKFITRTDDDYRSFVSFLRLNQHDSIIDENNLQVILSGISEITEDFKRQETLLEKLVERRFEGILNKKNILITREKAKTFAKENLEEELKNTVLNYHNEIQDLTKKHSLDQANKDNEIQIILKKNKSDKLYSKIIDIKERKKRILILKKNAESRADIASKYNIFKQAALPTILFLVLIILILSLGWTIMEMWTYFFSSIIIGLSYLYLCIFGKSFNPQDYFDLLKNRDLEKSYQEFLVDFSELEELNEMEINLQNEIDKLK